MAGRQGTGVHILSIALSTLPFSYLHRAVFSIIAGEKAVQGGCVCVYIHIPSNSDVKQIVWQHSNNNDIQRTEKWVKWNLLFCPLRKKLIKRPLTKIFTIKVKEWKTTTTKRVHSSWYRTCAGSYGSWMDTHTHRQTDTHLEFLSVFDLWVLYWLIQTTI